MWADHRRIPDRDDQPPRNRLRPRGGNQQRCVVADGLGGIRPLDRALRHYHQARDRAVRPMYDSTARLVVIAPPLPAEMALFKAPVRQELNRLHAVEAVDDFLQRIPVGRGRIRLDGLGPANPVGARLTPGQRCHNALIRCHNALISRNRAAGGRAALVCANSGIITTTGEAHSQGPDKRYPHAGTREIPMSHGKFVLYSLEVVAGKRQVGLRPVERDIEEKGTGALGIRHQPDQMVLLG